jgi:rSAM/selenodomain-associated transferase 1
MAKHPGPGAVKTRLARTIGADAAARIAAAFLGDLADRLRALGWRVTWAHWPPDAPFAHLVGGDACLGQQGRDLGERLVHAVGAVLADDPVPVLVLGADAPHVDLDRLHEAARALAAGTDVVLGPATDGGYWLIGLRRPEPALFQDVPWSTDAVLAVTRARAETLGLGVRVIAETYDVDGPEDLSRLRAALARGEVALPRTQAVLDTLGD